MCGSFIHLEAERRGRDGSGVATSALVLQISLQPLQLEGLRLFFVPSLLCDQLAERLLDAFLISRAPVGGRDGRVRAGDRSTEEATGSGAS